MIRRFSSNEKAPFFKLSTNVQLASYFYICYLGIYLRFYVYKIPVGMGGADLFFF